ncbi:MULTISPECIES: tail protein X [unclassified Acinetobacter]|uniref:tail protein X n=1 Tax=unclassified Acinetobacter TaxID=196816 RepID=UPI0022AC824D|nr:MULTISPECIES: tail protein X [unclassified Acinetobacter]WAU72944.1 tail protein X [Acinetobacter sp. TR11]WAU76039.1 tail protein X [Acinetobacter sp. TR3]
MTRIVKAMQNDTLDTVAYREYGDKSALYLPEIMELNPRLHHVILATHQQVLLPDYIKAATNETLKLWD